MADAELVTPQSGRNRMLPPTDGIRPAPEPFNVNDDHDTLSTDHQHANLPYPTHKNQNADDHPPTWFQPPYFPKAETPAERAELSEVMDGLAITDVAGLTDERMIRQVYAASCVVLANVPEEATPAWLRPEHNRDMIVTYTGHGSDLRSPFVQNVGGGAGGADGSSGAVTEEPLELFRLGRSITLNALNVAPRGVVVPIKTARIKCEGPTHLMKPGALRESGKAGVAEREEAADPPPGGASSSEEPATDDQTVTDANVPPAFNTPAYRLWAENYRGPALPAEGVTMLQKLLHELEDCTLWLKNRIGDCATCREERKKAVLVCPTGSLQAPVIAICFLMRYRSLSLFEAFDCVYKTRRSVWPTPYAMLLMIAFEKSLFRHNLTPEITRNFQPTWDYIDYVDCTLYDQAALDLMLQLEKKVLRKSCSRTKAEIANRKASKEMEEGTSGEHDDEQSSRQG
mmetsp:Transcript_13914/g.34364  ORF Transcript_13914/g.34364 Transcript_13914/m.34364 type:complete len:457 (-) Transcript_13914:1911-3281(-)|eukprot:g9075.t1